ncbi:MAG: hypothetical protein HC815_23550 [Richelia sp. RM1_1_1]|nr:hypothetical protein [Richelia sp. RM1_1_1]
MTKKKKLGDDFGFSNLDDFRFPKFKGTNGIMSPKKKLLPEPPLLDINISEPLLPDIGNV